MSFYDLSNEQREIITERIQMIIGKIDSWITEDMDRSERITARSEYRKLEEKLQKIFVKHGEKALAMNFMDHGWYQTGVTVNGKRWTLYRNHGVTMRSRNCGTLVIDGKTIFTSGTLARAFDYILNN